MSSFLSLKGTQETLSARNPETFLFPVSDIFFSLVREEKKCCKKFEQSVLTFMTKYISLKAKRKEKKASRGMGEEHDGENTNPLGAK